MKIESSLHEDEPQGYRADTEGALVIHEDLKTRDEVKKLQKGYSCKELRYANTSQTQVILPSYKEAFKEQTTRRVMKKKKMHICMKSIGKLQLKVEKYESTEDRSCHQDKRRRFETA